MPISYCYEICELCQERTFRRTKTPEASRVKSRSRHTGPSKSWPVSPWPDLRAALALGPLGLEDFVVMCIDYGNEMSVLVQYVSTKHILSINITIISFVNELR